MRKTKYQLFDYKALDSKALDRMSLSLVSRDFKGWTYYDLVVEFDNFVFVLQPKQFYSDKTKDLYQRLLYHASKEISAK